MARPPAKPVSAPVEPTMRWHGAMIERGFLPLAAPTARAAATAATAPAFAPNAYLRITPDDRLLFGGRARFAMSTPKTEHASALHAPVSRLVAVMNQM